MRRFQVIFFSLITIFVLSACSSGEGQFKREINKIDKLNESIVSEIESLQGETASVEKDFKETAQSKEEFLKKDTKADQLINREEEKLNDINTSFEDYSDHYEKLKGIEYDKLDDANKKHFKTVEQEYEAFIDHFNTYQEANSTFIKKQKAMLNEFKNEDSDFKAVRAYLNELNENVNDVNQSYEEFKNQHLKFSDSVKEVSGQKDDTKVTELPEFQLGKVDLINDLPDRLNFKAPFTFTYPENGVKGIYVSGYVAGGDTLDNLIQYMKEVGLNSVVIDVKGDYGDIMYDLNKEDKLYKENTYDYYDVNKVLKKLEDNDIYPIARIVTFKDTLLAEEKPEWSFKNEDGSLWENGNNESFINPFMQEVWDYNLGVAISAAEAGFKDIQFDYVRFPEGFETYSDSLKYDKGHYGTDDDDNKNRVHAITDFVHYAKSKLELYDVQVSVDIFGYSATEGEAPGIGQNFKALSEEADVMSSMIYPSHWGPGYFGIDAPDTEPFEVVDQYIQAELDIYNNVKNPPTSRPWLQDFTASYLGSGNYINYGGKEVMEQVRALEEHGVHEFLLWDASNEYSRDVNFK